jgi:FlgD Ig-like domain
VAVPVLVLVLLVGATAAFAVSEALKQERSPVVHPRLTKVFSPTCDCAEKTATLSVKLRKQTVIEAVVVDANDKPVRTLASGMRRGPGRITFAWDGRDDAGRIVPAGEYRLRMHVASGDRTIVIPNVVRVERLARFERSRPRRYGRSLSARCARGRPPREPRAPSEAPDVRG